jgi:hypothetical protein
MNRYAAPVQVAYIIQATAIRFTVTTATDIDLYRTCIFKVTVTLNCHLPVHNTTTEYNPFR